MLFVEGGRKPENLEATHTGAGRGTSEGPQGHFSDIFVVEIIVFMLFK